MTNEYSIEQLCKDAIDELINENLDSMQDEIRNDEPGDIFHEIADSSTPVYTYDILQYAANDINLATTEPELGAAFDGTPTPVNIIAANIYERIERALYDWWSENLERLQEELEEKEQD